MSSSRAMQRLCGLMRKAVQDYEMIAPGDKVMVGVSGGKDSHFQVWMLKEVMHLSLIHI